MSDDESSLERSSLMDPYLFGDESSSSEINQKTSNKFRSKSQDSTRVFQDSSGSSRVRTKEIERGVRWKNVQTLVNDHNNRIVDEKQELNELNNRLDQLVEAVKLKKTQNDQLQDKINKFRDEILYNSADVNFKSKLNSDLDTSKVELNNLSEVSTLAKIRASRSMYELDRLKEKYDDELRYQSNNREKIRLLESQRAESLHELNFLKENCESRKKSLIDDADRNEQLRKQLFDLGHGLDQEQESRVDLECQIQTLLEKKKFDQELYRLMREELERLFVFQGANKIMDPYSFYSRELNEIKQKIRDDFKKLNEFSHDELKTEYEFRYKKQVEEIEIQRKAAEEARLMAEREENLNFASLTEEFDKNKEDIKNLKLQEFSLNKLLQDLIEKLNEAKLKNRNTSESKQREIDLLYEQINNLKADLSSMLSFSKSLDAEVAVYARLLNQRLNNFITQTYTFETYENLIFNETTDNKYNREKEQNELKQKQNELEENNRLLKQLEEERRRKREEEERRRREEEERRRREEEERRRREEEERRRQIEIQELIRIQQEEKRRRDEEERLRREEEERRKQREREEEERRRREEEERRRQIEIQEIIRIQQEEKRRRDEEEERRRRAEEEERRRRAEEQQRREAEEAERLRIQIEYEERIRIQREEEEKRRQRDREEEERKRKRELEEAERLRIQIEYEERIRIQREEEEKRRQRDREEEERRRQKEAEDRRRREAEEAEKLRIQIEYEERIRIQREEEEKRRTRNREEEERRRQRELEEAEKLRIKLEYEERIRIQREEEERRRREKELEENKRIQREYEERLRKEEEERKRRLAEEQQRRETEESEKRRLKFEYEEKIRIQREYEERIRREEEERKRREAEDQQRKQREYEEQLRIQIEIKRQKEIEEGRQRERELEEQRRKQRELEEQQRRQRELEEQQRRMRELEEQKRRQKEADDRMQRELEEERRRQREIEERRIQKEYEEEIRRQKQIEIQRREKEQQEKTKFKIEENLPKKPDQANIKKNTNYIYQDYSVIIKTKESNEFDAKQRQFLESQKRLEEERLAKERELKLKQEREEYERYVLEKLRQEQEILELQQRKKHLQEQRERERFVRPCIPVNCVDNISTYTKRIVEENRKSSEVIEEHRYRSNEFDTNGYERQINIQISPSQNDFVNASQRSESNNNNNVVHKNILITNVTRPQSSFTQQSQNQQVYTVRNQFRSQSPPASRNTIIQTNGSATDLSNRNADNLSNKYAIKHKANRYVSGSIGILETSLNGEYIILENLSSNKTVNLKGWLIHRFVPDQNINIYFKFSEDTILASGDKLKIYSRNSNRNQMRSASMHEGLNRPPTGRPSNGVEKVIVANNVDNWGTYSKFSVTKLINQEGQDKAVLTQSLLRLSSSSNNLNAVCQEEIQPTQSSDIQRHYRSSSRCNEPCYQVRARSSSRGCCPDTTTTTTTTKKTCTTTQQTTTTTTHKLCPEQIVTSKPPIVHVTRQF